MLLFIMAEYLKTNILNLRLPCNYIDTLTHRFTGTQICGHTKLYRISTPKISYSLIISGADKWAGSRRHVQRAPRVCADRVAPVEVRERRVVGGREGGAGAAQRRLYPSGQPKFRRPLAKRSDQFCKGKASN